METDFDSHIAGFLSRNRIFRFLKVGELCNGTKSFSFSEARCDLTLMREGNITSGRLYGIQMGQLFEAGYEFLTRQINDELRDLSQDESNALTTLKIFLQKKDVYEQHILSALRKMKEDTGKDDSQKQTILTTALAEHLFSKLCPGQMSVVDVTMKRKGIYDCKCGCGKTIPYGKTGIGHPEVWHGFIDIIVMSSSSIPESAANVCLDFDTEFEPTAAKRLKLSDEAEEEGEIDNDNRILLAPDSISEVQTTITGLESIKDQVAAQTIVFALACQSRQTDSKVFIPNIVISPTKFYVVMYEPVEDILVWSEQFPLIPDSASKIQISSVIALWIVLHYKLFCHGSDIFEDIREIKASFKDRIDQEHLCFYQQLELGVGAIGSGKHVDLATSLCEEYDVLLPKLKLGTHMSY